MSAPKAKVIRINRKNIDLSAIEVPEEQPKGGQEEDNIEDPGQSDHDQLGGNDHGSEHPGFADEGDPQDAGQDGADEEDDPLKKAELIDIILDYHNSLGKHLTHYPKGHAVLQAKSVEELETQLLQMEAALASRSNQHNFKAATTSGLIAIEKASLAVGLQVQGWSAMMAGNENLQDVVQEIRIKRFRGQFQSPEARLIAIIGGSLVATHQYNKSRAVSQPSAQGAKNDDKYAAL